MQVSLILRQMAGEYAICRLPPDAPTPDWTDGPGIVQVTRARDELSVTCLADRVPATVEQVSGWMCFQVRNLADLDEPGVVLAAVAPVSGAGLGVFANSTFLRDYILVRGSTLDEATCAWLQAGHQVELAPASVSFRLAGTADASEIAEFHLRQWRETYADIAPPGTMRRLNLTHRKGQWQRNLAIATPDHAVIVGERNGEIAAIAALAPSGIDGFETAMELKHLYVDGALRRQGLGLRLLDLALAWAKRRVRRHLVLAVVEQNRTALEFYRACGGVPVAERVDKGPVWPSRNVVMRWPLEG